MSLSTLKLKHPIKLGESEESTTELIFSRRPKARDFKGMPVPLGVDEQLLLISRLTNLPLPLIQELDGADMMAAMEVLNGNFL